MHNSLFRLLILFDVLDELQLIYKISKFSLKFSTWNFRRPLEIFGTPQTQQNLNPPLIYSILLDLFHTSGSIPTQC